MLSNNNKFEVKLCLGVVIIVSFIFLWILSVLLALPISKVALVLFTNLFVHHANEVFSKHIGPFPFKLYIYSSILISSSAVYFITIIFPSIKTKCNKSFIRLLRTVTMVMMVMVICLQTTNVYHKFVDKSRSYFNSNKRPFLPSGYYNSYHFARFCQAHLPGKHKGKFITDLNINKEPAMLIHRVLAYYIYPIDIRDIHKTSQVDCLIIFESKNPYAHVPHDFVVKAVFDDHSLLAVRKE